jgi:hypothetical protein
MGRFDRFEVIVCNKRGKVIGHQGIEFVLRKSFA